MCTRATRVWLVVCTHDKWLRAVSWLQQLGEFVSAAVFRYKHQPSEAPCGRHGQWQRQQSLAKAVVIDLRVFWP